MFFLVAIFLLAVMHGFVAWRLIPMLNLSPFISYSLYIIIFIFGILPITPIVLRINNIEGKIIDWFSLLGYTSLGFFTLTFCLFILRDLFIPFLNMFYKIFKIEDIFDNSRRIFLKQSLGFGVIGITGTASAIGYYNARKGPSIIKQDIFLDNLPPQFENFTIAQISDLHVGPTIKRPYVEDVLNKISQINPDLIALTGDLVDGSVEYIRSDFEPIKDMIANYGTFFVTGNHEYYSGVDQWLDEIDRLGVINLINDQKIISKGDEIISIAGITDYRAHQIKPSHKSDPFNAIKSVPKNVKKIMLAHQPNSIYDVHKAGVDLQLSGHTHGGQFWPFTYPTRFANAYLAGHYNHDGTQIYVNRGTGYWGPPLRLGVESEITLIRLKRTLV